MDVRKEQELEEKAKDLVLRYYDLEAIAKEKYEKTAGDGAWNDLSERKRARKEKNVLRNEGLRLAKEAQAIAEISKWGLRNFITNIEVGSYRIYDQEGNTKGFAATAREAKKRAFEYAC